jgi:hypothetical protein
MACSDPQRPPNVDSGRPVCATSGRSLEGIASGSIDPDCTVARSTHLASQLDAEDGRNLLGADLDDCRCEASRTCSAILQYTPAFKRRPPLMRTTCSPPTRAGRIARLRTARRKARSYPVGRPSLDQNAGGLGRREVRFNARDAFRGQRRLAHTDGGQRRS